MRFSKIYEDVKASELFKPASKEELAKRIEQYPEVKLKELLDSVKKTKLPDGTWHVHGDLDISCCELTTIKNINISIVDGNFYCYLNKLTTLQGAPTTVNGSFFCASNNLTTLQGAPTTVNGNFYCKFNTKKFTEEEVRVVCDVKGSIIV